MQLSIKTPPDLTVRLLEKCVLFVVAAPSHLVTDLVSECLKWMDTPHRPFRPLELVKRYYWFIGNENHLLTRKKKEQDELIERLMMADQARRFVEADERLKEFKAALKKQAPPKHLHLKISQGMNDLPQRIKAKADWLRMTPNAFVMACLRDGLDAMDDALTALSPPSIVVQFWSVSHAKSQRKPINATDDVFLDTIEGILRKRSGPILDTIVRHALSDQWDVTLKQILREADALPVD